MSHTRIITNRQQETTMNVVAEIERINERELALGVPFEASWHQKYKESAWVYVGGLAFELTEGDVLCVMSQFGEIEDINLVRDGKTGKSKGFAFIKYENWLSTVLAVDNMNGARLLERTIRVDHVLKYKLPKEVQDHEDAKEAALLDASSSDEDTDTTRMRGLPGHAYDGKELATGFDISKGQNVFDAPEETKHEKKKRKKDEKKEKKKLKKIKKLEEKQTEWMEQVKRERQAKREQEKREQAMRAAQDGEDLNAPAPSETGWRGRLEPTVSLPPPRRAEGSHSKEGDTAEAYKERERKRRAGYGGINRIR